MSYPLPNFSIDLTGKVGFVTGASGGLGRRFAEVLASAGAAVALTGRRIDKLNELQIEIQQRGGKACAIELDVRDPDAIIRAIDHAEQQLGLINILVNNSGITDANWATKMSLALIDDVINTNFRAPFLVAREVARRLIAAEQPGRIVNLSSVGAYHYDPNSAASLYSATKSGVLRMTETLAMEWAKYGINVNAIAPGLFRSGMSEAYLNSVGDVATKHYPRKRVGEPPQLDSTLLYLVSPASEFVTGICIRVDDAQMPR